MAGGVSVEAPSVDPADVDRFDRLGASWWDENGPMGKLHEINPVRLGYLRDVITRHRSSAPGALPFDGLRMLDIGCGGGILSEPLCRLGGAVTGIDPATNNIAVAQAHAASAGLAIDYRATTAEALLDSGSRFDVVLAMEVVEHVADRDAFLRTAAGLVEPGGLLLLSTLNRTAKAFALAIVGAEYVLRWLPRGTHQWRQFVTPSELGGACRTAGLKVLGSRGMVYNPLSREWRLSDDRDVNYFLAAAKPSA